MSTEEKIALLQESGFETKNTIERFMGKADMYLKFLGKLLQDKNMEGFRQAFADKDVHEAFSYAHTLKGVAANLGIEYLLEELIPVVEILRAESFEGAEEWMPRLEERYSQVMKVIEQCQE